MSPSRLDWERARSRQAARVEPQPVKPPDWLLRPPTEKQLRYVRVLAFGLVDEITPPRTRGEAYELIRDLRRRRGLPVDDGWPNGRNK